MDLTDFGSLADYAHDRAAFDAALARSQPTRLHVVTPGPPVASAERACTGAMTCPCRTCSAAKSKRRALGAGPAAFSVKPARQRAA